MATTIEFVQSSYYYSAFASVILIAYITECLRKRAQRQCVAHRAPAEVAAWISGTTTSSVAKKERANQNSVGKKKKKHSKRKSKKTAGDVDETPSPNIEEPVDEHIDNTPSSVLEEPSAGDNEAIQTSVEDPPASVTESQASPILGPATIRDSVAVEQRAALPIARDEEEGNFGASSLKKEEEPVVAVDAGLLTSLASVSSSSAAEEMDFQAAIRASLLEAKAWGFVAKKRTRKVAQEVKSATVPVAEENSGAVKRKKRGGNGGKGSTKLAV